MSLPNEALKGAIGHAKDQRDYDRALEGYYSAADTNAERHIRTERVQIACRDGCSFCCYCRVTARAHEVLLIPAFVRRHFTTEQQSMLEEQLRQHVARISTLTVEQHHTTNIACPLLRDGRCSIYAARPLLCRSYHSKDVRACEYSFENPTNTEFDHPADPTLSYAWHGMTTECNAAYDARGRDSTAYELGSALLQALTHSASSRRWRDGKKAFVGTHT